jgi:PAS domain S-box-containing protein
MADPLVSSKIILDCLNDGVYVCDRERRIVFWSKAAERITGWLPEDVLGRACLDDILSHVDKDGHRLCGEEHCPLHRAMVTGENTRVPLIVFALGKDGRRIPMQVTTAPIRNTDGEIIGGVETFRDMTASLTDYRRARKIQSQSLAHELPKDRRLAFSAFSVPFDIVGGDYYTIQPLDPDRYGFLVADMEGHGVAAALYTMHLNILSKRHFALLKNPPEFASAINEELIRVFGDDVSFATAMCGFIDAGTGKVRLTGAGGPPPLIVRSNGRVERLISSGLPLGVMEAVPYQEKSARLLPGDALLLCSDGATEIHDADGRELAVEGFVRILKALDYPATTLDMNLLEEKLLKFSNAIRLPDDLTMVEIRYLGEGPAAG